MSKAKEMQRITARFLIKHGQLPALKDTSNEAIAEAEERLSKKLQEAQAGVENKLIDRLRKEGILPADEAARQEIIDATMGDSLDKMREEIAEGNVEGAKIGREVIFNSAVDQGLEAEFSEFKDKVLQEFRDKAYKFSAETVENIKGDFVSTLQTAYQDDLGIEEASDLLRNNFSSLSDSRVKTIARTEILSSQNKGGMESLRDFLVDYKQWITAEDDRVRGNETDDEYDHVALHGEVVEIDEPFSNGLMHPGDENGDAGQVINCRCTTRPYIPSMNEEINSTPYYP